MAEKDQIILDKGGNLWVAEYLVLEEAPIWQIFNPQGVWLDDLGVARIKMYGLNKWTGN